MITITAATGRYGRLVIDALLRRSVPLLASWQLFAIPKRQPIWLPRESRSVRLISTGRNGPL